MKEHRYSAFRLGDVRGIYPDEINEEFAFDFAVAFASRFRLTGTVATGRDMRDSSKPLQQALDEGFMASGLEVLDIGLCPTELGYYASTKSAIAATIIVTASHNPAVYNGFKCVLDEGRAVTFETGLGDVMQLMQSGISPQGDRGHASMLDLHEEYIGYLADRFPLARSNKARIVLNGLNGTAATLAGQIADSFSLPVTWFRREPGPIPAEGADPANPRLAAEMKSYMGDGDYELGVAWDGDCDRCVFFDSRGDIVPTYYIIGLLTEYFLARHPGRAIVFDTKLRWNTVDVIRQMGGKAIPSETGHAFMKRHMRDSDAIYGAELSSHHFFGDFFYCDSGMFAWLTLLEVLSRSGRSIEELVHDRRSTICCTQEVSLALDPVDDAFALILSSYGEKAAAIDHFDGLAMEFADAWRFSMKRSKTEPLVRLNFESRGQPERLLAAAAELLHSLRGFQISDHDATANLYIQ